MTGYIKLGINYKSSSISEILLVSKRLRTNDAFCTQMPNIKDIAVNSSARSQRERVAPY